MTPMETLIKGLQDIKDRTRWDPEVDHIDADKLLLEFIDNPEVTKFFEGPSDQMITMWYA